MDCNRRFMNEKYNSSPLFYTLYFFFSTNFLKPLFYITFCDKLVSRALFKIHQFELGKQKKSTAMAEGTRLTTLHEQVQALQNKLENLTSTETTIHKWWEEQQKGMEAKFAENQSYMGRMLELLMQKNDSQAQAESGKVTCSGVQPESLLQARKEGKKSVEVTVVADRGKYTYRPEEPGILPRNMQDSTLNRDSIAFAKTSDFTNGSSSTSGLNAFSPRPKIELPVFDGNNPRRWIKKMSKILFYFCHRRPPENGVGCYVFGWQS